MEELLEILEELHPDVDFENNKRLIDDHLLDSFDIITLNCFLRILCFCRC